MEQFVDRFVEAGLGYLPTLLMAVLVQVAGWIVAMIGRAATRGLLRRTTLDNQLEEWATGCAAGECPPVENAAARVVFLFLIDF